MRLRARSKWQIRTAQSSSRARRFVVDGTLGERPMVCRGEARSTSGGVESDVEAKTQRGFAHLSPALVIGPGRRTVRLHRPMGTASGGEGRIVELWPRDADWTWTGITVLGHICVSCAPEAA
jgi:hypothetical protein